MPHRGAHASFFLAIDEEVGLGKNKHQNRIIDRARDELFSHIHRCAVLDATEDQQQEWMDDTLQFMAERYPALSPAELDQLRALGLRFCQPAIPHGKEHTALSEEDANAA